MSLEALRPGCGASLAQLQRMFDAKGWQAALPSSLPDKLLLALARDLRVLEANAAVVAPCSTLTSPLYAAIFLMKENPARGAQSGREFEASARAMDHAMQAYQWSLEREIVTRITGFTCGTDNQQLLGLLQRLVDEGSTESISAPS